jgi:hypothetical protein
MFRCRPLLCGIALDSFSRFMATTAALRLPARHRFALRFLRAPLLPKFIGQTWQDLSGSWEIHICACSALVTPVESVRRVSGINPIFSEPMLPSALPKASASTMKLISRLYHAAYSLAVYASQPRLPVSSTATQDSLPGGDQPYPGRIRPAGSLRKVSVLSFLT